MYKDTYFRISKKSGLFKNTYDLEWMIARKKRQTLKQSVNYDQLYGYINQMMKDYEHKPQFQNTLGEYRFLVTTNKSKKEFPVMLHIGDVEISPWKCLVTRTGRQSCNTSDDMQMLKYINRKQSPSPTSASTYNTTSSSPTPQSS